MTTRDIVLGTDVASFVIFEPGALADHVDDEIGWYAEDAPYRKEATAGRLVAFATGDDGGYRLRLTTEAADLPLVVGTSATFRLRVSSGRVIIDNTDALPGEEQMEDPLELPDQWFALQPGDYRVEVALVDRATDVAELPDYLVRFTATDDLEAIPVAARPPVLGAGFDAADVAKVSATEGLLQWRQLDPASVPDRAFPVLADGTFLAPYVADTIVVPATWSLALYGGPMALVAAAYEAGSLATLASVGSVTNHGLDRAHNQVTLSPRGLVRLGAGGPDHDGVWFASVAEAVPRPVELPVSETAASLKQRITAAELSLPHLTKAKRTRELEFVRSCVTVEAITAWLLCNLDLSAHERFELAGSPVQTRLERMLPVLALR